MSEKPVTLEDITNLCLRRGFFYPSGRIYGGMGGFYDYGPLGVEMRRNVINSWWKWFVEERSDIYGIYGTIITHPKTWEASGHVESFVDFIVRCQECGAEYRADHLLEDKGVKVIELTVEELERLIREHGIRCPKCGGELSKPEPFNLMFSTYVGPKKTRANLAYLRPETAQLIFTNFKNIVFTMGATLPFGIAQHGKAFRNEISPRNFLFRLREFEQMEIEYFINPKKMDECPYYEGVKDVEINLLSAEDQENGVIDAKKTRIQDAVDTGIINNRWHAYWIAESLRWLWSIGLSPANLRVREHVKTELAHYAEQTFDIEYFFPYMGWKEIEGISNRTDYDLKRHQEYSGEELHIIDEGEKVIPYVIEPSFGVERIIMALLTEAYKKEGKRLCLALHPAMSPFKVAVFPLVKKDDMDKIAWDIYINLRKKLRCYYDDRGSIGRRYAKADEIGVPLCITVDGQTKEDQTVTIRFRDTRQQIRVPVSQLEQAIEDIFKNWQQIQA
ncbi:MAG: glycine--tRNA ligase, partial [Thermoprotei archaeon]